MLYAPSTAVYLLNVPITAAQNHQLSFANAGAQYSYFAARQIANYGAFTDFSFQRKDNVIRIPVNVELIAGCNYAMYQNSNWSNKWFYCFVTERRYINDNCTELVIKTDVFQTWLFSWNFTSCFVERMHTNSDLIGEHTEPEPVTATPQIQSVARLTPQIDFFTQGIILYFSKIPGAISGVSESQEDSGALSATWEKNYNQGGGGLPAFRQCMDDLALIESAGEMELISGIGISFNAPATSGITNIDFYDPPAGATIKNEKTKLYCFGLITGNSTFKVDIENCGSTSFDYIARVNQGQSPFVSVELLTVPHTVIDYSGFPFPRLPINSDINQISRELNITSKTAIYSIISSGLGMLGGAISGGGDISSMGGAAINAVVAPVQSMINTMAKKEISDIMPKQLSGFTPSPAMYTTGEAGVYLIRYAPPRNEINAIDDFFTAFGYAVNTVTLPRIQNRLNHDYIKTTNCLIVSNNSSDSAPQEDLTEIEGLFNRGLTIWHNPATFGNYNATNTPV